LNIIPNLKGKSCHYITKERRNFIYSLRKPVLKHPNTKLIQPD